MPLSNIHRVFGGLHSWPARRLHIDSPDFSSAGRASCSPSTAAVLDTKMAAVRILEGTQSAGFLLSCSRANCWAPTASTSGAPCVRLGNAARKLMRLLSQKANGIHVNLCLWPISALASWRSGSLCLGMKRKRASMSSPPCKSVHPPLILHFSLKALLGLPTPTEMPSINRRPAQEEPPPCTDSRSENVYRLRVRSSSISSAHGPLLICICIRSCFASPSSRHCSCRE